MVETISMVTQHNQANGVDGLETSVSDGARPETPKVDALEWKIQGLMVNVQLLME